MWIPTTVFVNLGALMQNAPAEAVLPAARERSLLHWIGPCASFLCLIHCLAMAIIAIVAPGILAVVPHSERLEIVIAAVAIASGLLSLRRLNAPAWAKRVFAFFAALTAGGLAVGVHSASHFGLFMMAMLQVGLLVRHTAASKREPACCAHGHHH